MMEPMSAPVVYFHTRSPDTVEQLALNKTLKLKAKNIVSMGCKCYDRNES